MTIHVTPTIITSWMFGAIGYPVIFHGFGQIRFFYGIKCSRMPCRLCELRTGVDFSQIEETRENLHLENCPLY